MAETPRDGMRNVTWPRARLSFSAVIRPQFGTLFRSGAHQGHVGIVNVKAPLLVARGDRIGGPKLTMSIAPGHTTCGITFVAACRSTKPDQVMKDVLADLRRWPSPSTI